MMRHARNLLWITLSCAVLGLSLLAWPRVSGQGGWAPLEHAIWALAVAAGWALLVLGYLLLVVIRGGITRATAPALAVLLLALGGGAWFAWQREAEEAACLAAGSLPLELAALPPAARTARIAAEIAAWRAPNPCLWHGLVVALEGLPGPGRHALLEALLSVGLPPDQRLLYGVAISLADAEAAALLVRQRLSHGDVALPAYILDAALDRAMPCGPNSVAERREVALSLLRAAPATPLAWARRDDLACLGWEAPVRPL